LGWAPTVDLREGLRRTLAFYRAHLRQYVEAGA
jgi:nucleoside-diphosphate-sugar epimerase